MRGAADALLLGCVLALSGLAAAATPGTDAVVLLEEPAKAAQEPASDLFGTLIRTDENLCLDAAEPLTLNSRLHMWPCEPNNHKEIWDYRWDIKQVKHSYGMCLTAPDLLANPGAPFAMLSDCNKTKGQKWDYDPSTGAIKAVDYGLCLDGSEHQTGQVKITSCDKASQSQTWTLNAPKVETKCVLTPWSPFTQCTKTCGVGVKKRVRVVIKEPTAGKQSCGHLVETQKCEDVPCHPQVEACKVSEWGIWGRCTHKCGGGKMVRTREVTAQASAGGEACPELNEGRECNTRPCLVEYDKAAFDFADNDKSAESKALLDATGNEIKQEDAAASLAYTDPNRLTKEEKELLQDCRDVGTDLGNVTVQKDQALKQLDETQAALTVAQETAHDQAQQIAHLEALNANLTVKLQLTELAKDKLEQKDVTDLESPEVLEEREKQTEAENAKLMEQLKNMEVDSSQTEVLQEMVVNCRTEKSKLESDMDDMENKLGGIEAKVALQDRDVATCNKTKDALVLARDEARAQVAAAGVADEVNVNLLAECKDERNEIATLMYEVKSDKLALNRTVKQQRGMLDECMDARDQLTADLGTTAMSVSVAQAAKDEMTRLYGECSRNLTEAQRESIEETASDQTLSANGTDEAASVREYMREEQLAEAAEGVEASLTLDHASGLLSSTHTYTHT